MKHEVPWNIDILNIFTVEGNLTPQERKIMKLRSLDYSGLEIAEEMGICERTYYRRVQVLKKKYDNLRKFHPELPERLTIKETSFDFFNKENAIEFVNNNNFDEYVIEMKLKKKKKA